MTQKLFVPQVSPTELEGLLLEHPLVTDVGVTSVPAEMEGELPQAWVVRKNQSLTEKMVQDYIAGIFNCHCLSNCKL